MLKLILLRHGKAMSPSGDQLDIDRPLNRKGLVQINQVGHILKSEKHCPKQVITSSAERTLETSEIINHYLKIPKTIRDKNLYLADEKLILSFIQDHATEKDILYVGHNFGISNLASFLRGSSISMSTGMMLIFKFNTDDWKDVVEGSGVLDFVYSPDIYLP